MFDKYPTFATFSHSNLFALSCLAGHIKMKVLIIFLAVTGKQSEHSHFSMVFMNVILSQVVSWLRGLP
jgi:hypothetical protein